MTPQQVVERSKVKFGEAIGAPVEFRGEVTVTIPREKIVDVCGFLKHECTFDMLTDLSGVDNYGEDPRYDRPRRAAGFMERSRAWLKHPPAATKPLRRKPLP